MIKVDMSNVWGEIALPDLLAVEHEVAAAHNTLSEKTGPGNDFLGWLDLPVAEPTEEMKRIQATADRLRECSEAFVVIGIGGSYLGPRAAIELMQGCNYNLQKGTKGNPQIFFAGNGLSTRGWNELMKNLEGKDFSIAIISKSGTTTEPAIATRALVSMLKEKYGAGAKDRIFAITDPCKGALRQMATEEGWETFVIPGDVGGRFSVLTPVGLLPMAVAGIDIDAVMSGANDAKEDYDLRSFENPVWLYAAVRNLMYRRG